MNQQNKSCSSVPGVALLATMFASMFAIGCGSAEDPQVARYRTALELADEPKGSVTIEDARSNIESVQKVVLTGRIGVPDLPKWWSGDTATIYISEGTKDSHYNPGEGHNPATCPFCKRKWKVEDSMAIVNFVDDSGKPVPVSAKKLWGNLQEGDFVVVRGTSSLDEAGSLVVESDGLFIR